MRPILRRLLLLLLVAAPAVGVAADGPSIWLLEGPASKVYLLGSVHVLRQQDYPLPAKVNAAYVRAPRVVMELDLDDLDPVSAQAVIATKGLLKDGRSLRDVMGERDWQAAEQRARALGVELSMLSAVKPWFAALTLLNLEMLKRGFDPALGLENHLATRAAEEGKPVIGLESLEYQLSIFDKLPERTQSALLLQSLDEAAQLDTRMGELIAAWRAGDDQALADTLAESFEDYPQVYASIVTARNHQWADRLIELSRSGPDALVVVGALHLVGRQSVINLLRARGYTVRRWSP